MNNARRIRAGVSGLALVSAIAWSTASQAQDPTTAVQPTTQDASDAAPAAAANNQIGEIVITARRKEETLQNAAIPVDVVSGNALVNQGIETANDLTKAVPALSVVNGGGQQTSIFIRGVGNITTNAYYDSAIAPTYDGVVLGRPSGAFGTAFYDLSRVEVLKGPQGILYGRNATGGAINIIPNHPSLKETGAGLTASYGNFDALDASGYINVVTSDSSALRISATRQRHDGYNRDGTDDLDRYGARAQFLFQATPNLSVRVAGDYTRVGGMGAGQSYIGSYIGPNFIAAPSNLGTSEGLNTDAANAYRTTVLGAPGFGFLNPLNRDQKQRFKYYGVHAEVNWSTPIGDVTFIPAYRDSKGYSYFYGPAFNTALFDETAKQLSSELRLAGKTGRFDYIVGAFLFDEDTTGDNEFNQEFVLPIASYKANSKSLAGFGQLTFNASDRLRLVGGLRYTRDKKSIDGSIVNFITFCGGIPPVTPPGSFGQGCAVPGNLPHYPNVTDPQAAYNFLVSQGFIPDIGYQAGQTQVFPLLSGSGLILKSVEAPNDSGTFSKVTWKASTEFDLTDRNLLYATVETGYRAGGFQLASGATEYDPETITAFTVGSKNRFLGNRLQVNLEAFYWRYKDQQINFFSVSPNGVLLNATQNVGRSDIKGFDVDMIAKPFARTTLRAKAQYLDTKYKGLLLKTAPPRDNFDCPRSVTGTLNDGVTPIITFDCSGRPLLNSPKWTFNFGAEQEVPISSRFDLVASVNTAYRSSAYGNFNYQPFQRIPAYWVSDASLSLRESLRGWTVSAFVNNIENKRRVAFPQLSPIGFAVANYTPPRTYGLRLSAGF